MYAVIRTGGKQYTVKPGDVLQVPKLDKDLGAEFDINEVLMVGGDATHLGQPLVKDAKVTVVVTKQARTRKLIVFKKKRRHSYRNFQTHKQDFTEIFVKSVTSPDGKTEKTEEKPNVVDVAAAREERLLAKQAASADARANKNAEPAAEGTEETKKAAPKKKAVGKSAKKKAGAKKASKKKANAKKKA